MKNANIKTLLAVALFSISGLASAHQSHNDDEHGGWGRVRRTSDRRMCHRINQHKPHHGGGNNSNNNNSIPLTTVQCGDVITTSIKLANNLNCPDTEGFALNIVGNNITIDGNNKTITAPNAAAGLFVQGDGIKIKKIKVNGVLEGPGILAYDSNNLKIYDNTFNGNLIGISVYAESKTLNNVEIYDNEAVGNSLFGIRTGQDGIGSIVNPNIHDNDFSFSGSYAALIKATSYELENDKNKISGSENGYYLAGGNFYVHDLNLKNSSVKKIQIFVDSVNYIKIRDVDVSSNVAGDSNQERIGIDLYRVTQFDIKRVTAKYNDAGIKLENEGGAAPYGKIEDSYFKNNTVAGVLVVSYDGSAYGNLKLDDNCYSSVAQKVYIFANTTIGSGSDLDV